MSPRPDYASLIGTCDVLMMTLDALRYDVAVEALEAGSTPNLARMFPGGWEQRHSPGNFTYAAHAALFAGFWPTPVSTSNNGGHTMRPFAVSGVPSRSVGARTCRLGGDSLVEGLRRRQYHTVCIGGVGFFDKRTPLGRVFPAIFDESHWEPTFAPTSAASAREQSRRAARRIEVAAVDCPLMLFVNYSATHPPTRLYVDGARSESAATQRAALGSVDRHVVDILRAFTGRSRSLLVFCMSDHGTTFGEDGFRGHRIGHPLVWTVPYAEAVWESSELAESFCSAMIERTGA